MKVFENLLVQISDKYNENNCSHSWDLSILRQKCNSAGEIFNSCCMLASKSLIAQVTWSLEDDNNFFLLAFNPGGIHKYQVKNF